MNPSSNHFLKNNNPIKQSEWALIWGALFLTISILLGALGAHAFENIWETKRLKTFLTGVHYQQIQGLGLLFMASVGLLKPQLQQRRSFQWSLRFIFLGSLLFSGFCYLYAFTSIKVFALIVPVGGILMILGWPLFAYSIYSTYSSFSFGNNS
jgi:uncharacterized membrane protein YgdD (TMEM256/DUF423 family)